jgi:hypothetical protein
MGGGGWIGSVGGRIAADILTGGLAEAPNIVMGAGDLVHKITNMSDSITPDARLANATNIQQALANIQAQRIALQKQAENQGTFLSTAQTYNKSALDILQGAASGNAPSQAQAVLQQGLDQSIASQYALAQSGNLSQQIAGQKQAQGNIAQLQQQTANEAGALRAQEMAANRQNYAAQAGQNLGTQSNYMNALNASLGQANATEANVASGKYSSDTSANAAANQALQNNNPLTAIASIGASLLPGLLFGPAGAAAGAVAAPIISGGSTALGGAAAPTPNTMNA